MKWYCVVCAVCLAPFNVFAQNRYDIIIDEIMADPSPVVGLPNYEWIELRNISGQPVNLQGWKICDASSQSGAIGNITLQPDSSLVICGSSALSSMVRFGLATSVTSFPSLDNESDLLYLKSSSGKTIHAVNYSDGWYRNELKKSGGWSLEMIDIHQPCEWKENWIASRDISGGTPGRKNSEDGTLTTTNAPVLKHSFTTDSLTVILVFDKTIDSLYSATLSLYTIDNGLSFISASCIPPLFDKVLLRTNSPMRTGKVYHVTTGNSRDCSGRTGLLKTVRTGIEEEADTGDLVINEILFNPRASGNDYVEFYNKSNKIVDAARLSVANRNSGNVISSVKRLSEQSFFIFPGDYIVETPDRENLSMQYLVKEPGNIFEISSPPSYPDEEGDVILLNSQGIVVDEVKYKDDWHFKLISDPEGISLERIDPSGPSNDFSNWHSAASTAGYGTPGYINSQYKAIAGLNVSFEISPSIFSPDNDGKDDFATLSYSLQEPGYVCNARIFDAAGRQVRRLVNNGMMGLKGSWTWDGLDDNGKKLPLGVYIIYSEIFNLEGKKKQTKNAIVLAGKLNR